MLGKSGKNAFFTFQGVLFVVLIPQADKLLEQVLKFGKG